MPERSPERRSVFPGFSAATDQLVGDLARERQRLGLSQTEVAARMGTSQSAVARLEAGGGDVRFSTLERYAAAVNCALRWQVEARHQ